jgi:chromosome segregation ATPase
VPESYVKGNYLKATELAKKTKLLNKNVFFEKWLPADKRNQIYNGTDLILITHKKNQETEFSYRNRTIDALGAKKIIIATKGDSVGELINEYRAGILIEPENPIELKHEILAIIDNKKRQEEIKKNINILIKEYSWDKVIKPITDFCNKPTRKPRYLQYSPYRLIEEKNEQIEHLRYKVHDQTKVINAHKKSLNQNLKELKRLQKVIKNSQKEILEKNHQIEDKKEQLKNKEQQLNEILKIINDQKKIIENQTIRIGNFTGSIVYPIYKITSRTGRLLFNKNKKK